MCVWCVCGTRVWHSREGQGSRRRAACSSGMCHTGHIEKTTILYIGRDLFRERLRKSRYEWLLWTWAGREPCPHESQRMVCAGCWGWRSNPTRRWCRQHLQGVSSNKFASLPTPPNGPTTHSLWSRREDVCIADGWSRSHLEQSYSTVHMSPRCQML